MNTLEQQTKGQLRQSNMEPFCPQCEAIMTEADRLVEGPAVFVWYTCSTAGCDERRLRKFVKDRQNV